MINKVYEREMRARLGTAANLCQVFFSKRVFSVQFRTPQPNTRVEGSFDENPTYPSNHSRLSTVKIWVGVPRQSTETGRWIDGEGCRVQGVAFGIWDLGLREKRVLPGVRGTLFVAAWDHWVCGRLGSPRDCSSGFRGSSSVFRVWSSAAFRVPG